MFFNSIIVGVSKGAKGAVWRLRYSDVAVGLTPGGGKTVVTSRKHPDQVLGPLCVHFPG